MTQNLTKRPVWFGGGSAYTRDRIAWRVHCKEKAVTYNQPRFCCTCNHWNPCEGNAERGRCEAKDELTSWCDGCDDRWESNTIEVKNEYQTAVEGGCGGRLWRAAVEGG